MFCPNCGKSVADSAKICPFCKTDLLAGVAPRIENHLVGAILSTLFCCLPLGIVSIVFANQVNAKLTQGDVVGAQEASKKAKGWMIASIILGLLFGVLYTLGQVAQMASRGPR